MEYLSLLNENESIKHNPVKTDKDSIDASALVLATNPILESFGNSKTSRNNNSSRFGKWLEIVYDKGNLNIPNKLKGAKITQYLLEKSRVVSQSSEERNYHIFYQLCSSSYNGLNSSENYKYLNSGCLTINGVNDKADLAVTVTSMKRIGFTG